MVARLFNSTMHLFYSDTFELPLPTGHRFPMPKYTRLRERLKDAGSATFQLLEAPAATDAELLRVHTAAYLTAIKEGTLTREEQRRIGFPWSPQMIERTRRSVGGTLAAARSALQSGIAVHLAGGTHHAYADAGQGFCVFNDAAVAARALQAENSIRRVLILDCDVHQGNGTAAIFERDTSVFTFSIHGAKNFPFRKHPGDLDIALPDNTGDAVYLAALRQGVKAALERSEPDFVIYLAGADPYVGDKLGRLALSKEGLARRDRFVFETTTAMGLPTAVAMAGGYAPDIDDIVDIQTQTVTLAAEYWNQRLHQMVERSPEESYANSSANHGRPPIR